MSSSKDPAVKQKCSIFSVKTLCPQAKVCCEQVGCSRGLGGVYCALPVCGAAVDDVDDAVGCKASMLH